MVGVGVVGVGGIGKLHAKNLKALPEVTALSCYDVSPVVAAQAKEELGLTVFGSLTEMVQSSEVDAVFVCTPPFAHREVIEAAAAAGKHVFCEKPIAADLRDARGIQAAVRASGVKFAMGFVLRYWPVYAYIRRLIDERQLGALHHVWLTDIGGPFRVDAAPWRRLRRNNAGIAEQAIHEIDALRFLAGDVASVYARGGRYGAMEADYEDNLVYSLALANGGIATIIASLSSRQSDRGGGVIAQKGALVFNTRTQTVTGNLEAIGSIDQRFPWNDPFLDEARGFIVWLEGGAPPKATLEDGVKATEVAEAACVSLRQSAEARLPLVE